jgi:hypothetical protein
MTEFRKGDLTAMHYNINLRAAVSRKFNLTSSKMGFGIAISEECSF